VAAFLYPQLARKGWCALHFAGVCAPQHETYLKKMGFVRVQDGFIKTLEEK
jgi:hypothetical protein